MSLNWTLVDEHIQQWKV